MNLKRLLELSKAQADGKTIMCYEVSSIEGYKVDIDEVDFDDFIKDETLGRYIRYFYIKGEEDRYGKKLTKPTGKDCNDREEGHWCPEFTE